MDTFCLFFLTSTSWNELQEREKNREKQEKAYRKKKPTPYNTVSGISPVVRAEV